MTEETNLREEVKSTKEKTQEVLDALKKQNEHIEEIIKKAKEDKQEVKPKKVSKALLKKGYVNYIYIRENNEMDVIKLPVDEATAMIDKAPRLATPVHILNWKGVPTIIQGSWSCEPFSPAKDFDEAEQKNLLSAGWRLLANRQELGEIKPKKKMSGALIIGLLAAAAVVIYLLFK